MHWHAWHCREGQGQSAHHSGVRAANQVENSPGSNRQPGTKMISASGRIGPGSGSICPSGRTAADPCGSEACVRAGGAAEHWRNKCSACSACSAVAESQPSWPGRPCPAGLADAAHRVPGLKRRRPRDESGALVPALPYPVPRTDTYQGCCASADCNH